jgi:hypothetical protein
MHREDPRNEHDHGHHAGPGPGTEQFVVNHEHDDNYTGARTEHIEQFRHLERERYKLERYELEQHDFDDQRHDVLSRHGNLEHDDHGVED